MVGGAHPWQVALGGIKNQAKEIQCPLLTFMYCTHVMHQHTFRQSIHTHEIKLDL